jgi:ankyrin
VIDLLLDRGADIEAADVKGFGALHAAAEVGSVTGIRYLLAKGAKIQAQTKNGLSPLHIACALGHIDATRELVERGADIAATSELGTPLEVARREGKGAVVAWLESQA